MHLGGGLRRAGDQRLDSLSAPALRDADVQGADAAVTRNRGGFHAGSNAFAGSIAAHGGHSSAEGVSRIHAPPKSRAGGSPACSGSARTTIGAT